MDLGGFQGQNAAALWPPVATCGIGALPLKKDCSDPRLQYSRLGVLEAWSLGDCTDPMLQYSRLGVLEAWRLGALEAWRLGLDCSDC